MSGWINVERENPKTADNVYVLWGDGTTSLASYRYGDAAQTESMRYREDQTGCSTSPVTHWHPLPKPEMAGPPDDTADPQSPPLIGLPPGRAETDAILEAMAAHEMRLARVEHDLALMAGERASAEDSSVKPDIGKFDQEEMRREYLILDEYQFSLIGPSIDVHWRNKPIARFYFYRDLDRGEAMIRAERFVEAEIRHRRGNP